GDPEVALEEVDDGQIAGPLPVGQSTRLQDEPLLRAMGARELEYEAGFAHAGLTDEREQLTTAAPGTVHCRADLLGLGVAPDELAQAARDRSPEPRANNAGRLQFVDVGWCRRSHLDNALGQPQGFGRDEATPGPRRREPRSTAPTEHHRGRILEGALRTGHGPSLT